MEVKRKVILFGAAAAAEADAADAASCRAAKSANARGRCRSSQPQLAFKVSLLLALRLCTNMR